MKQKISLLLFMLITYFTTIACEVCEKQQPQITRGITHGTGPQSDWDWVIVAIIAAITLYTLVFSIKYLVRPKEKNTDHIKYSILS